MFAYIGCFAATAISYDLQKGCGTTFSLGFALLGWKIVTSLFGSSFSDTHARLVSLLGAFLSASFLILVLWIEAVIARRRGYLLSASSLAKMLAASVILYFILLLVAFPVEKCF